MRHAIRILGGALAVALGLYFAWLALPVLTAADLAALNDAGTWGALMFAAACYALIIPISAWAWAGLLRHYGEAPRWLPLARIMARTQLAKYLPGNVAQHGLRLALSLQAGVRPDAFAGSVIQETLLAMGASLAVGIVAMALAGRQVPDFLGGTTAIVIVVTTVTGFIVVGVALHSGARLRADRPDPDAGVFRALRYLGILDTRSTVRCVLAYSTNFVVIGVGLALLARATGMPQEVGLAAVTGAFALSWVLGFLAPGVPAGLGVREGIMALLLAGTAPQEQLVTFVLLARLATMAGDAACFTIAWFHLRAPGDFR